MKYKIDLTDKEEKIFLQEVVNRMSILDNSIREIETDVQKDESGSLKSLQEEFKLNADILRKFVYGEDFVSGFSKYVDDKQNVENKQF